MTKMCVSSLSNDLVCVGCILFCPSRACSLWVHVCVPMCVHGLPLMHVCVLSQTSVWLTRVLGCVAPVETSSVQTLLHLGDP